MSAGGDGVAAAGHSPAGRSDVADLGLAEAGRARIDWAQRRMPALRLITEQFARDRPFTGLAVAACLHITPETASLVTALRAGGAEVYLAASNPLSTQDDVAAALAADGSVAVYARAGVGQATYADHIHRSLDHRPDLVIDDGGDLVDTVHAERPELIPGIRPRTGRGGGEGDPRGAAARGRVPARGRPPGGAAG
jgi:adenosylhomocysteinase